MAASSGSRNRSDFNQVGDVLDQLHKAGVVDLDKSMREMLAAKDAYARVSPGGEVATSIIAWDGYGLIIKGDVIDTAELATVAERLRSVTGLK